MRALLAGETEEKYELLSKLSEGGMGAIFKVRHRLLDEVRVIKVIRSQHARNPQLRDRFMLEARTAIALRHPNIAEILDFSVDAEGQACIVMEYIDGIDLKQMLSNGGPPALYLALEISAQALRALGFLHQRGFVHRDISPDNLMLTSDHAGQPLVKLIDLGIAKRLGGEVKALTATGMFVGKVQYSAPEQFQRDSMNSPQSDLYAFGVLLYELLTGQSPIAGTNVPELITNHVLHPPRPFESTDPSGSIPEGVRAAILQALEKKPADRHADAAAFADALAPFRGGKSLTKELQTTLELKVEGLVPEDNGSRVSEIVSQARLLVGQQNFEAAQEMLQRALELAPQSAEAKLLMSTVEQMLRLRAEAELQQQIASSEQMIQQLIDAGRLADAERWLGEALKDFGAVTAFTALQKQLEQENLQAAEVARLAERQQQIAECKKEGMRLAEAGELESAEAALRQALELDPEDSSARQVLENVLEAGQRLRELHSQQIETQVKKIERALDAGQLETAAKNLVTLRRKEPTEPRLGDLDRRLQKARAEAARVVGRGWQPEEPTRHIAQLRSTVPPPGLARPTPAPQTAAPQISVPPDRPSLSAPPPDPPPPQPTRESNPRPQQQSLVHEPLIEARALMARGDLDGAEDLLELVLQLDPEHRGARLLAEELIGRQLRRAEGLRTDPIPAVDAESLLDRAKQKLAQADPEAARDSLHEVLVLEPGHAEAHRLLESVEDVVPDAPLGLWARIHRLPLPVLLTAGVALAAFLGWWLATC